MLTCRMSFYLLRMTLQVLHIAFNISKFLLQGVDLEILFPQLGFLFFSTVNLFRADLLVSFFKLLQRCLPANSAKQQRNYNVTTM